MISCLQEVMLKVLLRRDWSNRIEEFYSHDMLFKSKSILPIMV